ncbi:MAG: hypothetical protein COB36_01375 [Alphaproteobacteria bacterium]|nr:MAG: hypothetical protein COB36_01375 [Alphaproteobacteria bacterium]
MGMQKLIEKLLPLEDLYATVRRFPLPVMCALGLFFIVILGIHDIINFKEDSIARVVASLGCCYFWFGISKLMSESQGWSAVKHYIISFIVAGGIIALFALSSVWAIHLLFVLPALLLGLMIAPYLTSGDDISVWFFNRTMWFGVVVSYAALIMFAGGLSAALGAIQVLFDMRIKSEIYGDIWSFAALVLGPVYALSWVPKKFEFTEEDCNDPPGLKFIVNWISAPMVFVYLLILYAYFGKIIMTGEVPNGHLAWLISGFAGAGIVTYLVAWPLREEGSLQLKLFYKIFFPALLIPVGFHFYAIWERISAYGITEQRYLLMISAIWFLMISLSNSFTKIPLKAIPMMLVVLMVFASFGPWGGVSISGRSQFSRLEKLLIKHDLIVDGKVVKAKEDIPFDDRLSISSILDYLCRTERDAVLRPLFIDTQKENLSYGHHCYSGNMTKQLGFEYVNKYNLGKNNSENFNIWVQNKKLLKIDGYDFLLNDQSVYARDEKQDDKIKISCVFEDKGALRIILNKQGDLIFKLEDDVIIRHNLNEFVIQNKNYSRNKDALFIDISNDKIIVRIFIKSMGGEFEDKSVKLNSLSFDVVLRLKDE